jgi:hypothetical protein
VLFLPRAHLLVLLVLLVLLHLHLVLLRLQLLGQWHCDPCCVLPPLQLLRPQLPLLHLHHG